MAATNSRLVGCLSLFFTCNPCSQPTDTHVCIVIIRVNTVRELTVGLNQLDFLFCRDKIYWG